MNLILTHIPNRIAVIEHDPMTGYPRRTRVLSTEEVIREAARNHQLRSSLNAN